MQTHLVLYFPVGFKMLQKLCMLHKCEFHAAHIHLYGEVSHVTGTRRCIQLIDWVYLIPG